MQARFYEKGGGFGVWAYTADGVFEGPVRDASLDVLGAGRTVLEDNGLEISETTTAAASRGAGSKDGVLVTCSSEVPAPDGGVARG